MSYKDYYASLGVSRTASAEEIQKAFRALARKHHPDVNKGDAGAEERFKQINEAYDVLKDPDKRRLYDKYGTAWKAVSEGRQPAGAEDVKFDFSQFGGMGGMGGAGFDPNDLGSIFEQFFVGQQRGAGGRARRAAPRRGPDIESAIELGVAEAFEGGSKELAIRDPNTGELRHVTLKIPKGIRTGQRIRLKEQGTPGPQGNGDLFLDVKVVSDAAYKIDGDDLTTSARVPAWDGALGTTTTVKTLDGEVRLKVPPGSSSGRRFRIRGKGYPKDGAERGDLYVNLELTVPESLTDRQRELFEALAGRVPPEG